MAVSPVWRRAPGRAWRRGGAGVLLLLATLAAVTSAASAPEFSRRAGDDQLARLRDAVPSTARTADSDDVRLMSGTGPTNAATGIHVLRLKAIPGLTPPTTLAFSLAPEVKGGDVPARPLVRHGSRQERARLAAVDVPTESLVVTRRAVTTGGGVWLPDPVADELGVRPGDDVSLLIQTHDAVNAKPHTVKDGVARTLRLDGTYAVGPDGRRPADPPGTSMWSRRVGGLPNDSDLTSLAAYLAVTDVATAQRTAEVIGDDLLWATESHMEPGLTLEEAQRTAAGVAALRKDVYTPTDGAAPGFVTLGLVSGIESIVDTATWLRDSTAERALTLAAAGTAAGLLTVLAVAVLLAIDRRVELRQGAALGMGPVRTSAAWLLESLLPVLLGTVGGIALAHVVLGWLGPQSPRTELASQDVLVGAVRTGALALAVVAVVAFVGVLLADRVAASRRSVPWVWLLVVAAGTAVAATATAKGGAPGALALSTPALVAFSVGALVATVVAALAGLRRRGRALPSSTGAVGRWLGRRRAAAGGGGQVLAVAALALGLGLVLVTTAAVNGTRTAIDDRTAVRAGAAGTVAIEGTWLLDPDTPKAPTQGELEAGVKVPVPPPVVPPEGSTAVWRATATVDGYFGYRDVLAVDPVALARVADWGSGQAMADVRSTLALIDPAAGPTTADVPVVAVAAPGLAVGDVIGVQGFDWRQSMRVVATAPAFPGLHDRPMLVAAADTLFPQWGAGDPRLAPPDQLVSPRGAVDVALWTAGPIAPVVADLEARKIPVKATTTRDAVAFDAKLDAAQRSIGYQVALALYLVVTAVVVLVAAARRSVRRSRSADAMLARVGVGRRGLLAAYGWELVWIVGAALVGAVLTALVVRPLGAALFDLDRAAVPAFEFRITGQGLLVTAAVAVVALLLAAWTAARNAPTGQAEEVVLRDG